MTKFNFVKSSLTLQSLTLLPRCQYTYTYLVVCICKHTERIVNKTKNKLNNEKRKQLTCYLVTGIYLSNTHSDISILLCSQLTQRLMLTYYLFLFFHPFVLILLLCFPPFPLCADHPQEDLWLAADQVLLQLWSNELKPQNVKSNKVQSKQKNCRKEAKINEIEKVNKNSRKKCGKS